MTVSTVTVTCRASLQNGDPVPGAIFTFKLDRMEVSLTDDSVVAPEEVTVVADEDGLATWETWPNELGTQGSSYRARGVNPVTGKRFLNAMAVVPNEDSDLENCLDLEVFPPTSNSSIDESEKDAANGVPSLTGFALSLMNVLGTFKSYLTNSNTSSITYLLQNRNGTLADDTDISGLQTSINTKANKALTISSKSADYTLVIGDTGSVIYHPAADTTARTFMIPANASVAFDVGTTITFDNDFGAGAVTISITTDTLVLVGTAGTTGARTLASGGQATAVKVSATLWRINGTGLS